MSRGTTSEIQTELKKSQNMPVHFVSVHLDAYILYMNDSYKTIDFGGNSYLPTGNLMGFSDIVETAELIVSSMTLSLSGVSQDWISLVLNEDYINREVKVYTGFLNRFTQELIPDPFLIFDGRIDTPTLSENPDDGTSIVSVSATNAWVDFNRMTGRHSNNEEQQMLFPGDKGFEFAGDNITDLIWGKDTRD